jgi:ferredoxin--NADP+ reductase
VGLPGIPFDSKRGVIPNTLGRVEDAPGRVSRGEYVAGWIKRGPSGVIGTNKPDAVETVEALLEDERAGTLTAPAITTPSLEQLLAERGVRFVTYDDWRRLDELERANGAAQGRPRLKFTRIAEMLVALDQSAPGALHSR